MSIELAQLRTALVALYICEEHDRHILAMLCVKHRAAICTDLDTSGKTKKKNRQLTIPNNAKEKKHSMHLSFATKFTLFSLLSVSMASSDDISTIRFRIQSPSFGECSDTELHLVHDSLATALFTEKVGNLRSKPTDCPTVATECPGEFEGEGTCLTIQHGCPFSSVSPVSSMEAFVALMERRLSGCAGLCTMFSDKCSCPNVFPHCRGYVNHQHDCGRNLKEASEDPSKDEGPVEEHRNLSGCAGLCSLFSNKCSCPNVFPHCQGYVNHQHSCRRTLVEEKERSSEVETVVHRGLSGCAGLCSMFSNKCSCTKVFPHCRGYVNHQHGCRRSMLDTDDSSRELDTGDVLVCKQKVVGVLSRGVEGVSESCAAHLDSIGNLECF